MTITIPEGLALNGADADGTFDSTGVFVEDAAAGIYMSDVVNWPDSETTTAAIYALSFDKKVLAAGFLTDLCSTRLFDNLPGQKFAIWVRQ
jgi:hypothetical protein